MPKQKPRNIRDKVSEIRQVPGNQMRAYQRREHVTQHVISDLKKTGVFFKTRDGYFYFLKGETPKLYPIEGSSVALSAFIGERFGINAAEKCEYNHIITALQNEAHLNGRVVEVQRLAHYDIENHRLYVSRFDGWVYCLNGKSIRKVPNGANGIFFWDDPQWEPYETVLKRKPEGLLIKLISQSANFTGSEDLSPEDQQWIFSAWLCSQFFASLHPTKPILLVCGEKGGGKTICLRKWLRLLFGHGGEVTALERSKADGFVAAVCSQPVAVFDNVDEHVSWLPDHLAQLATGVSFKRRRYYTTNEQAEYQPRCYLALTSRTPKFVDGRDDVLDRTLVLRTERLPTFDPEHTQLMEIAKNRNLLWTQLLRHLNQIVEFLRHPSTKTKFRMADFAQFAASVALSEGCPDRANQILGALEGRRAQELLAFEPISVCLESWLANPTNCGKTIKSGDLNRELGTTARCLGIEWPHPSAHSLGQRLGHILPSLKEQFQVETEKDTANQVQYRFQPKAESLNPAETNSE
jgi:hypothetical protein